MVREQDLFNYIFFPGSIPDSLKEEIKSDKTFEPIVEFYNVLKEETKNVFDYSLKKEIASRIQAYSLPDIIYLYPLHESLSNKINGKLAADSKELTAKLTTRTFVDNEKEYLIKVLNYGNMTKIFVFSTKDELIRNFDLFLEPLNLRYHFEDNSEPLKIENTIEAQAIRLEFS